MRNKIQINRKLMEREDGLLEIFDLERQINLILGGEPYPFDLPEELPSLRKRKKVRRTPAKQAASAPTRLRKLDHEKESAYRIIYRQDGIRREEIHFDPKPLTLIANTPLPRIEVLRIETVQSGSDGGWVVVETLMNTKLLSNP